MNPPKMPIHIGDYKRDTGHLYAAEHGAYLLLLFHHWSTGALPVDDRQLAAIACMTASEWKRTKPVLAPFFYDGWKHKRVEYDLEKARNISESAREAGKASGRSRSAERPLNDRSSSVEPTLEPLNHSTKEVRKKETREDALSYDFEFAGFWDAWPNKVGKPAALKAFLSARKRAGLDAIVEGVFAYIRDKPPDRPWLNPATFLNQNRWEDQPAQVTHGPIQAKPGSLIASINRDLAAIEQSEGSHFELPEGRIRLISN